VTDGVALAINYINDVVAKRAYSRKLEMEADEVGLSVRAYQLSRCPRRWRHTANSHILHHLQLMSRARVSQS
jgi:Zn-dependent protease with chaperone function